MSREQGPRATGMRPAAIAAGRRRRNVFVAEWAKEATE